MKKIFFNIQSICVIFLLLGLYMQSCKKIIKCDKDVGLLLFKSDKIINGSKIESGCYIDTVIASNRPRNIFRYDFDNCLGTMKVFQYSILGKLEKSYILMGSNTIDTIGSYYYPNNPPDDLTYKAIYFRKPILVDSITF